MNGRIEELVSAIPYTNTFADVGCDHGYVAEAMLKSGKCKKAYVSDVSEKCLEKAKKLLAGFISAGSAEAFSVCRRRVRSANAKPFLRAG